MSSKEREEIMIFRSQYGDGKIVVCNVVIPKFNSKSNMYEMWVSYDGREDTYHKIAEYKNKDVIGFLISEGTGSKRIIDLEKGSNFYRGMGMAVLDATHYIEEHF